MEPTKRDRMEVLKEIRHELMETFKETGYQQISDYTLSRENHDKDYLDITIVGSEKTRSRKWKNIADSIPAILGEDPNITPLDNEDHQFRIWVTQEFLGRESSPKKETDTTTEIFEDEPCAITTPKPTKIEPPVSTRPRVNTRPKIKKEIPFTIDKRFFGQPLHIEFVVPEYYNPVLQMDGLLKMENKIFSDINPAFNSQNFGNPSDKLAPHKKYSADFFPIVSRVPTSKCIDLYRGIHALMTGGTGLTFLIDINKDFFPKGTTFSFDEEEALWTDADGHIRVPRANRNYTMYDIGLGYMINECMPGNHILCIKEINLIKG